MKRLIALLLCLLLLVGCGERTSAGTTDPATEPTFTAPTTVPATTAQRDPDAVTPLFWHITGKNGGELWLLGTIHVGDTRTENLPWQITTALEAADALAVECDVQAAMDDMDLMVGLSMMMMYSDGTTISDHIPADLYENARQRLTDLGLYAGYCDYLQPMAWESLISETYAAQAGLDSEAGVDMRLLAMAKEEGLEIREVESGTEQYELLFGFSDALQAMLLRETVDYDPEAYQAELARLLDAWCAGDEAALREMALGDGSAEGMTEEDLALYTDYYEAIYTSRNAGMAETAISYLESGDKVFFAVGTAHMLGDDGIIAALEAAGYTVEQIPYN